MNYIKIYENFITDRNKLLHEIELIDKKMEDEILDLLSDTLEIDGFVPKFYKRMGERTDFVYYFNLTYHIDKYTDFQDAISFKYIKDFFIRDIHRLNGVLSINYKITYGLCIRKIFRDKDGVIVVQNIEDITDVDFNSLKSTVEKYDENYYFRNFGITINEK